MYNIDAPARRGKDGPIALPPATLYDQLGTYIGPLGCHVLRRWSESSAIVQSTSFGA